MFTKAQHRLSSLATVVMLWLTSLVVPAPRRASARRGAEFIEVALYAAVILAIAIVFREQLADAFNGLLARIRAALQ